MDLAKGMNPRDIAQEAILKVYEGQRAWNPSKHPDLRKFLKNSVIDSMFNELAESADNTTVERFPEKLGEGGVSQEPAKPAKPDAKHACELVRTTLNPEEILIAEEEKRKRMEHERQAAVTINALLEAAQGDPEVTAILECGMIGLTKPRDIATKMEIPISAIYNAQKRLRLMALKIRMAK